MAHVINIRVNGVDKQLPINDNELLLDVVRDKIGVKSAKAGCWRGECGLCTVLLDGKPVKSCLTLGVEADGKDIKTAEGLASQAQLSALQKLFVEKGAMQCGFCTPSFVLVAYYLLQINPNPTEREIREYLNGHICRCGTYKQMIEAILEYAKQHRQAREVAVPPPRKKTHEKDKERSN